MLKVRNLKKVYKSKKGLDHYALKDINLDFGTRGFIFILGKSGSGKSTLLNVIGGLDRFNDGDIIIKGKSSKSFKSSEWDSYRNTYLGFVFQDFNIIDSYSIEKNIQLALELQSFPRKGMSEKISVLLKQVEMDGMQKRKPNELSGGQKQRIAIARALIKEPEIILADEPTGALDSNTSVQVLNILRNLAEEKLIIMVSHDREFAYRYADRIITLKDGEVETDELNDGGYKYIGDKADHYRTRGEITRVIKIPHGEKLDREHIADINKYILRDNLTVYIPILKGHHFTQKTINLLNDLAENHSEDLFIPLAKDVDAIQGTDDTYYQTRDNPAVASLNESTGNQFKLIKSKLPLKDSFKMALGNISQKPIKVFFSILLFLVSIGLFGFSETITKFDFATAVSASYKEGDIDKVSLSNKITYISDWDEEEKYTDVFVKEDINALLSAYPEITTGYIYNFTDTETINSEAEDLVQASAFKGFLEIESLSTMDLMLAAGAFPSNTEEIVLSDYVVEYYKEPTQTYEDYLTGSPSLKLDYGTYKVVGVLDTDWETYKVLNDLNEAQLKGKMNEVLSFMNNDNVIYSRIIVAPGFYDEYSSKIKITSNYIQFNSYNETVEENDWPYNYISDSFSYFSEDYITEGAAILPEGKTTLEENEILLGTYELSTLLLNSGMIDAIEDVEYLQDWETSLQSKYDQLEANNLINFDVILYPNVNTSWGSSDGWADPTTYKIVGIVDFNIYRQNVLEPESLENALISNDIEYYEKDFFNYIIIDNYMEYVETIIEHSSETYLTYDEWKLTSGKESKDFYIYDYLHAAFNENGDVYFDNIQSFSYTTYLGTVLTDNSITFDNAYDWYTANSSTPGFPTSGGEAQIQYLSYIQDLLDDDSITGYLDETEFSERVTQQYSYANYLQYICTENLIERSNQYDNIWSIILFESTTYEGLTLNSGTKVHELLVNLSDDTDYNADFFRNGKTLGFGHTTTSGALLDTMDDLFVELRPIFLIVSLLFAGLSVVLIFALISGSVLQKKKDIGTLRAIGARGRDVSVMFLLEGMIISVVTSSLAIVALFIVTTEINAYISEAIGISLSIFNLQPIIVIEIFAFAIAVAVIASYLPVKRVNIMKPIDAINNK